MYYSTSSSNAGDFQTARGRWSQSSPSNYDENTALPSSPGSGSFSNYWYAVYAKYTTGPPPPDTTPPTVSITNPADGATVGGTISVTASASDNVGVDKVEFYIDGSLQATDTSPPYSYSWDTTSYSDGSHTIMAKAYDTSGNTNTDTITVTVDNTGGGNKYAIIVGISDYQSISDLSYCDEDATDWYYHLNGMGYDCQVYGDGHTSDYPIYTGTAYESTVRSAIQNLASVAQPGDTVVFTTSGHGSGNGYGSSYLCMYDCSGSQGCYYDTELAADIGLFADGVKIFVFIDHCYSGGMGPELMALSNSANIYVATTCTQNGYGYDDPSHQNGAWTYYFLAYSWQQHFNSNPHQSMESVFDYALSNYPHGGGDTPQEFDGNSGAYFYLD
ncbi:MAG: Ig-like domain-containing protein [Candidatus Hermodarchaeota archaeon]